MEQIEATILDAAGNIIGAGLTLNEGVVTDIAPPAGEVTSPYLFPGFVDIHCHGGGGASFPDDNDQESIETAAAVHRNAGTTHLIASLVSAVNPVPAITALVEACERGTLVGIHLEGPFISPDKAGAQDPAAIRAIDVTELKDWLEAGRGWIKTMTLAPERDGAVEAAELLLQYGAVPSWGHTNASAEQTATVLRATSVAGGDRAPAQTATHLFNAMPPLGHRAPGPVRELIESASQNETVVELVGDGIHVDTKLVADIVNYLDDPVYPGTALVTDAIAAAGMSDGDYVLGGLAVTVTDGTAYLTGTTTIAGGTSTLAQQVAILLEAGVEAPVVARAACLAPARAIALDPPASPTIGKPLTGVLVDGKKFRVWRDGAVVGNV